MGSFFRSEEMMLYQIVFPTDCAHQMIAALGEASLVQFRDLNQDVNVFHRSFSDDVTVINETERRLRVLVRHLKLANIPTTEEAGSPPAAEMKDLTDHQVPSGESFDLFYKLEAEFEELNKNELTLRKSLRDLLEYRFALRSAEAFLVSEESTQYLNETDIELDIDEEAGTSSSRKKKVQGERKIPSTKLRFVFGVIQKEKKFSFEKTIWRYSMGNAILQFVDLDEETEPLMRTRAAFTICFHGESLGARIPKICEGYQANIFSCPEHRSEIINTLTGVTESINETRMTVANTAEVKNTLLKSIAKHIRRWLIQLRKTHSVYLTMNLCNSDTAKNCLIAECWMAKTDVPKVQRVLQKVSESYGNPTKPVMYQLAITEDVPTFNRLNKFTVAFQNLIDAYGVGNYREINPALFTIITFPFIFAVMFGDLGHGSLMTTLASLMVIFEKKLIAKRSRNEIWKYIFGGRYIILLMGMFSMYTGIIYNDLFSVSINIFGSKWKVNYNISTVMHNRFLQLDPATDDCSNTTYPFGMDPVWHGATNSIDFLNVYKMKIAIIFGILQMTFGIFLNLVNLIYFKNITTIFCEFVPQIIFFSCLFVYLVIIIFYKWIMYGAKKSFNWSPRCAPSILITFIDMVLVKKPGVPGCGKGLYRHVGLVQIVLLMIALVCVPWMLLIKPIIQYREIKKRRIENEKVEGEAEDTLEIFVHQCIHTIEFVLGSVSYTASYLRLWALSLAHNQLSEVLWKMVFSVAFRMKMHNHFRFLLIFALFGAWATLTFLILVVMEGLSAFLHALRLHWMEFQSKFFSGRGYAFIPFSFKHTANEVDEVTATTVL